MPCFYAHDSFGLKVVDTLSPQLQNMINNHKRAYRIGLQGPDFLFYFHPIKRPRTNDIGHKQHRTAALSFFKPLVSAVNEFGIDSNEFAYALGCLCHFALDSECHPYVIRKAKEPGYNHICMENEFDRYLLLKDGISPLTYRAYEDVPATKDIANAIYHDYAPYDIPEKEILGALKGFRFYLKLFTCSKSVKRCLLYFLFMISGHKRIYHEQIMAVKPLTYASETNQVLITRMNNAYPVAKTLLTNFFDAVVNNKPLTERLTITYRGEQSQHRME